MKIKLWTEDPPYAEGDREEDIPSIIPYLVKSDAPTSAVVVCPGGGYQMRADHEGEPVAKWLNSIGISAFVLNYRVAPYRHPVPKLDAQRAIRYIRYNAKEWNIDKNKIGILGFSAGGHLAATIGTHFDNGNLEAKDDIEQESCRPDLLVLCYPVISFDESVGRTGSLVNLLGENPDPELRNYLSNEKHVSTNTPPTFIWHTADDTTVWFEHSLLFSSALGRHQIPFDLHIYQNGKHGLGLAQDEKEVSTWTTLCELWLKKQGF